MGLPQDNPIYIRENLALHRNMRFNLAKNFRRDFNYKFIWTTNGRIFLRKTEYSKLIWIENEQILKFLDVRLQNLN